MLRKFRISSGEYEIVPAEVLSVNFSDENPNLVNTIRVKVANGNIMTSSHTGQLIAPDGSTFTAHQINNHEYMSCRNKPH